MDPPFEERPGDVLDGFHLYDRPLLVSYPRSGTNWLRYIVEFLSERPTPGQVRLVAGDDYVIDRAHCGFRVMDRYRKVILILRDYRECLLRQHQDDWPDHTDVLSLLTDEEVECPPGWYLSNIEAFDRFPGRKLLVYYEDLITNPETAVGELSRFLDFDTEKTQEFVDDIDTHYGNSIAAYRSGGHESVTSHSRDLCHHAKTKLTTDQTREFDDFYLTKYPDLAGKYLSRYVRKNPSGPEPPVLPREKRLRHILLSTDGRWLLDWTPRAASHGIIWTFLEANGLLEEANRLFPEGETRLHDYRFHHFYREHGYCSQDDLLRSGRLRFKLVRNPYDRVITSFLRLHANRPDFETRSKVSVNDCTFLDFLEWLKAGNLDRNVHWMPQRQPFEEDLSFWDCVIHAEGLEASLDRINARWGLSLKPPAARHLHSSTASRQAPDHSDLSKTPLIEILKNYPSDYGRFFNDDTIPLIESLFGDDARFYGYDAP